MRRVNTGGSPMPVAFSPSASTAAEEPADETGAGKRTTRSRVHTQTRRRDLPQSGTIKRVAVVIPAFNDWESVQILLANLAAVGAENDLRYDVFIVDDASSVLAPERWKGLEGSTIQSLKIIRLACNMGHQRAIAVGLVAASEETQSCCATVVMDGDGEDRPVDVPLLLAASGQHPGAVVCARRARRSDPEGPWSRAWAGRGDDEHLVGKGRAGASRRRQRAEEEEQLVVV
jgi:glycosyltransferase involved in cell wall biosynthesis